MQKETKVVNVKVVHLRPQYDNLESWCNDPNNVYIGRRGVVFVNKVRYPQKDSIWYNPYKVGKDGSREEVIAKYEVYIKNRLEKEEGLKEELKKLKGKTLGCWCSPEACHGDILLKLLA